jgi:uncharacterized membrane protein YfcA
MKLNKNLFMLKIWLLHLIIFYIVFGIFSKFFSNHSINHYNIDTLYQFFLLPVFGLIGFLDGFPGFIFIPILLMYALVFLVKKNIFFNYCLSIFTCYLLKTAIQYVFYDFDIIPLGIFNNFYYTILFTLLSLILSASVNWLVFRKTYQKLKESE